MKLLHTHHQHGYLRSTSSPLCLLSEKTWRTAGLLGLVRLPAARGGHVVWDWLKQDRQISASSWREGGFLKGNGTGESWKVMRTFPGIEKCEVISNLELSS